VRNLPTLVGRELRVALATPLAWVVLALFLLVQGYAFYLLLELLSQPLAPPGPALRAFFGGTSLYWLFVILVVTVTTMRLVAEERRSGTFELLMTAPVTEAEVVLGKYLGALLFYAFLWLPTGVYVVLLGALAEPGWIDLGPVASGYLGTFTLGAACIAVGLFASATTRSQLLAAMLTFALLALLCLLGPLERHLASETLRALCARANLFAHLDDFGRGLVDVRHLTYHASLAVFFLFSTVKLLERRKGR
jgi:ABC-type transport system involved in multi-copper enzyme maturation permease subunit